MTDRANINKIDLKHGCWVDSLNRIYYIIGDIKYLGKIYWKMSYFHATNLDDKKYEGQKNLETLLINFLTGEGILK